MKGKRIQQMEQGPKAVRGSGEAAVNRKSKSKARKRKRVYRILVVITAVLLALCIGVLAWWKTFAEKPTTDQPNPDTSSDTGDLSEIGKPVRVSGDRKEDFYTFLVIGRDTGGGGNTDTVLLVSYDQGKQDLNVMSIPRDTMVNVSWDVKKINSVYNNYGAGDKGIEALGKELSQLVGFVPDFQVVLEWKAVGELVDALDGVTYDVPRNMYYVDPKQNLTINLKKGVQKLNGDQAMQVVRFRDGPNGYANGDLGRIETQQGFLKAVVQQCLSIKNVTRINELANVFKENVKTNLTINNLAWFAEKAIMGLKMENVQFYTMPCENARVWSRSYHQKLSYVVPKTEELVALVNQSFNPYVDPLKSYELDIMKVNSDGTIGSSTGKLEDTKANASLQSSGTKTTSGDKTAKNESSGGSKTDTKKPSKTEEPGSGEFQVEEPTDTPPLAEPESPGGEAPADNPGGTPDKNDKATTGNPDPTAVNEAEQTIE